MYDFVYQNINYLVVGEIVCVLVTVINLVLKPSSISNVYGDLNNKEEVN